MAELTPTEQRPEQFRYTVAVLESSFRYRVQAGDGRTKWHTVTAIDRPALAEVKLVLTAPKYANRPVYEKDYLPSRVQAVQGSSLRLLMRPKAELKSFQLRITQVTGKALATGDQMTGKPLTTGDQVSGKALATDDQVSGMALATGDQVSGMALATGDQMSGMALATGDQTLVLTADRDGWYRFEAILEEDVAITPELLSPHHLTNEDTQKCSIHVIPDRAPVARVISPTEEMAVSPDEVIEVKFEAHDDHGITKAELVVYEESPTEGEPPTILSVEEVPLDDQQNAPHVLAAAKLDLSKYDLQKGSNISYAIRVTDNRLEMREQSVSGKQVQDATSDEMKSKPAPKMAAKSSSNETAKANRDEKSKIERSMAEAVASTGTPQDANESRVNSNGISEPVAKGSSSSTDDSKNDDARSSPKKEEPSDAERIAKSESKKDSPDLTESNSKSTGNASSKTKDDSAEKTVTPSEGPSNNDSKTASAPSTQTATQGAMKKDAESKSTQNMPMTSEADPKLASAKESEPRKSKPSTSGDTPPRDDQKPNPNQSEVTGDVTSVNLRPKMTDDLNRQFTESNRLRLKIEEKLNSAAESSEMAPEAIQMKIRQRLEQIDRQLKPGEEILSSLVATVSQSGIADPQIKQLNGVDEKLAKADEIIANLRKESQETAYAFAGLHMVEIGMAHITPARDRVFSLIRQPDVDPHSNVAEALHRVSRARELLAELLVRYERVLREERLANAIEETAKFYEVYVENLHRFLRAQSKPNPNPLQRKLAIVEVDQDYLDRLRQVTEMRRDLMSEFGRMLADDPRLLSKYMDLLKRRQTSLRDRLTELHERQEAIATELSGWVRVAEAQREDVWALAAEVRLQDVAPLAQEASQLEERTTSQFPLSLDRDAKNSLVILSDARQLAVTARSAAAKGRRLLRDPTSESVDLASDMDQLAFWLAELDAALEQLAFDNPTEEVTDYTNKRLAECRRLFERMIGWTEIASHLQARRFEGLAKVDQQQLAFRTELLRIEIEGIDQQLAAEFRNGVPETVTALAIELKQLMEGITFNQAAATFDLELKRLSEAESQQALALEGFKRAEDLFDQIRRKTIEELDKIDPDDPNIADLEDPTLDQLLERLEREPDLNALLGLPNRPQNLRVISDFIAELEGQVPVPLALEEAAEQARNRGKKEEKDARRMRQETNKEDDKTEEEWREVANAEEAQEKLLEKIDELKRRAADPKTEPEEAAKLKQAAEQLEQMRNQLAGRQIEKQQWEEMIRSDQMRAVLRAAARGEPLPDTQWNRLMSSLDDGLWQVRRRTPPEEFRQAIEQYQERIRKLRNLETADESP